MSDDELPTIDEIFTIGNSINGKKFSEKISDKDFLKWVNERLANDYSNSHPQLKRFHKYCRVYGAYSGRIK